MGQIGLFMKRVLLLLSLFLPSFVFGQILKERRVYYLDCSYSMKELKIWDKVRDNLKNAIDNVTDETSELIVIPFADNTQTNPILAPVSALATSEGKQKLKLMIDALPMNKSTMTYHYVPIEDFYKNRVNVERVTYMFLMTDGQDEDKAQRTVNELLPQWGEKFGDKNVYGFYVMLHGSAKNDKVERVINNQPHLWKVESADVNVNLIRLQNEVVFNVKNDKSFDLSYFGDLGANEFNLTFPVSSPFKIGNIEKVGNKLRVYVKVESELYLIPETEDLKVSVTMNTAGNFDFLVTDYVNVKCENKYERSLKVTMQ